MISFEIFPCFYVLQPLTVKLLMLLFFFFVSESSFQVVPLSFFFFFFFFLVTEKLIVFVKKIKYFTALLLFFMFPYLLHNWNRSWYSYPYLDLHIKFAKLPSFKLSYYGFPGFPRMYAISFPGAFFIIPWDFVHFI